MSYQFKLALCWLLPGTVACFVALGWTQGSYIDGEYLPMGHDAFYHARRILDAVPSLSNYYQFDPTIHAPEGSWINWPWFYDWFLALLTIVVQWLSGNDKPMTVLVYIPVFWVYINTALLLGIATALRLSFCSRLVLLFAYALSPLTLSLHGVGSLDHHFMEQSAVFIVMLAGILWFSSPEIKKYAVFFGVSIGLSQGIHNGLFILLAPVVVTFLLEWRKQTLPGFESIKNFALAYFISLLLMLIPSEPFRQGFFQYFTLSNFHLYVCIVTISIVFYLRQVPATRANFFKLIGALVVLAIPILSNINIGLSFITGDLYSLSSMTESLSLWEMLLSDNWTFNRLSEFYSLFIWLLPMTIWIIARKLLYADSNSAAENYFWMYSLFGLAMLVQQFRFHHYGSMVLVLPLLYVLEKDYLLSWDSWKKKLITVVAVSLAFLPGVSLLASTPPLALDKDHHLMRPFYMALAKICDEKPGIVLANMNDGHYISYYTKCSVIADNFIQTKQHIEKIKLSERLFLLPVEKAIHEAPWIDYYFARVLKSDIDNKGFAEQDIRRFLLADNFSTFTGLKLLAQSNNRIKIDDKQIAVARIFRVNKGDRKDSISNTQSLVYP